MTPPPAASRTPTAPDTGLELAVLRTRLALDRTQLAWVRTGFVFITAGIAIDKVTEALHEARVLAGTNWVAGSHVTGLVLVIGATLLVVMASAGYVRAARDLAGAGGGSPGASPTVLALTALVVLVGTALAVLVLTTPGPNQPPPAGLPVP